MSKLGSFLLSDKLWTYEPQVTHVDPHSLADPVSESLKLDQLRIRKVQPYWYELTWIQSKPNTSF